MTCVPKTEEERLVFQYLDLLEEYVKEIDGILKRIESAKKEERGV